MADLRGLADGFLAGFNTMDNALQRREESELRRLMVDQQQKNEERNFGLAQAQFDYGKESDNRNFEREASRDKVTDQQWGLAHVLNAKNAERSHGLQAQSNNLAQTRFDFQMAETTRQQRIQDEMPVIKMFYDQLDKTGNIDSELLKQASPDHPLNPKRFIGDKAIKNVTEINRIMPAVLNGDMDYNDPAAISVMNNVLSTHIQRGIGDKDPETGKTIKSKELGHIGLTEDGQRVIPTLKVTYTDGSVADKPMTRFGSTDPNDTIAPIALPRLMEEIRGYSQMVGQLNYGGRAKFLNDMVNPPDKTAVREEARGLRKDLLDVGKARAKALADPMAQDPQTAAGINSQYDQLEQQVRDSYGQPQQQPKAQDDSGLQQWAAGDQGKTAFAQKAIAMGVPVSSLSAERLEAKYLQYTKGAKASAEAAVANQLRQARSPQE
ncbi:hypothetical protein PEC301653_18410 [Pectobacterium carotovorum subsp. carotovorum]|uniref:hypothetical protein n=1 Tax=Pectobacterium TaxID=122277 RepID=UPI0002EB0269|nr:MULTISPECIES: hypothetical protein [Pectobacterium]MBN3207148.1 hypothetical protein [Pectobacterium brasiliense]GKV98795.1 hypothetical protein PEC301653_18410 [Pectobacterium carotovorum subsp. carotovorum]